MTTISDIRAVKGHEYAKSLLEMMERDFQTERICRITHLSGHITVTRNKRCRVIHTVSASLMIE
jgi:hypothetical protein